MRSFLFFLSIHMLMIHGIFPAGKTEPPVQKAAMGNFLFGHKLQETLLSSSYQDQNLIFSPLSISLPFIILANGAQGDTLKELIKSLHISKNASERNETWKILLDSVSQTSLAIHNALWLDQKAQFLPLFQKTVVENIPCDLRQMDVHKAPDQAIAEINRWAKEKTQGMIPQLLQKGSITNETLLIATNTIYLQAPWRFPFDPRYTRQNTFTSIDQTPITLEFMHQTQQFLYWEDSLYEVIALPYAASPLELSLWIILPKPHVPLKKVQKAWNLSAIDAVRTRMKMRYISLELPRMEASSELFLKAPLETLGIRQLFSPQAKLDLLSDINPLFVSDAIHKAVLSFYETGTRAAAATAILGVTQATPPENEIHKVCVNRPFLFLIQENHFKLPLFMGQVVNPTPYFHSL